MNSIQSNALRLALGAFRTSPVATIQIEAGEPPLWIRRQQLQLGYITRVLSNPNNITYKYITHDYDSLYQKRPRLPKSLSQMANTINHDINIQNISHAMCSQVPPWTVSLPSYDLSLLKYNKDTAPPELMRSIFNEVKQKYSEYTVMYTDAAKTDMGVGCGLVSDCTGSLSLKLPKETSIYTAELYAILQAIETAKTTSGSKLFAICSDSLSSIQAIKTQFTSHPIVCKIHSTLSEMKQEMKTITLIWTPGHCGITGNELADAAAKRAITSEHQQSVQTLLTVEDVLCQIKIKFNNIWQHYWHQQNTKLNRICTNIKPTTIDTTRREGVILRRLRIGHTLLTHGHLLEHREPPQCEICDTVLTVEHILVECPKYETERLRTQLCDKIQDLLEISDIKTKKLLLFLKRTELYNTI